MFLYLCHTCPSFSIFHFTYPSLNPHFVPCSSKQDPLLSESFYKHCSISWLILRVTPLYNQNRTPHPRVAPLPKNLPVLWQTSCSLHLHLHPPTPSTGKTPPTTGVKPVPKPDLSSLTHVRIKTNRSASVTNKSFPPVFADTPSGPNTKTALIVPNPAITSIVPSDTSSNNPGLPTPPRPTSQPCSHLLLLILPLYPIQPCPYESATTSMRASNGAPSFCMKTLSNTTTPSSSLTSPNLSHPSSTKQQATSRIWNISLRILTNVPTSTKPTTKP